MFVSKLFSAGAKCIAKTKRAVSNKIGSLNSIMELKIDRIKANAAAKNGFTPVPSTGFNTLEDIRQFNKERLGIKHFDIEDFETAEWITEGLRKVYNNTKGEIKFPKRGFKLADCKASDGVDGIMGYDRKKDLILINRNLISQAKETAHTNGESLRDFMFRFGRTKLDGTEAYIKGSYHELYHELGHKLHSSGTRDYRKMSRLTELKALGIKDDAIVNEFVSNAEIQQTAGKISTYAQSSPNEFVAETFSQLLQGQTLPEDVMKLYKKYNGPMLGCFKTRGPSLPPEIGQVINEFIKQGYTTINLSDYGGIKKFTLKA